MEYKTPKVLEKKPVIAGFDLVTIVVIAVCSILFLFTVFVSFLLSIVFIGIAVVFVKIQKKYPQKGQLSTLLKYNSSIKCVRIEQPLRSLLKTK
ncbi:hypothetical protein GCM10009430_11920 [Aquimarina litoralis]|uniref:DUF4133 domain-containing protein n=1 Tax=Aquimarina litoralis TaxID=584605 RepID=A0ABN1IKP3_9FLAO